MCKQVYQTESQKYNFVAKNYGQYKKNCLIGFNRFIHEESVKQKTKF